MDLNQSPVNAIAFAGDPVKDEIMNAPGNGRSASRPRDTLYLATCASGRRWAVGGGFQLPRGATATPRDRCTNCGPLCSPQLQRVEAVNGYVNSMLTKLVRQSRNRAGAQWRTLPVSPLGGERVMVEHAKPENTHKTVTSWASPAHMRSAVVSTSPNVRRLHYSGATC